ncbi:MAG TPA: guanylate kinase [Moheibacter sp.]|nr:guanylate kinase [Moheibacter sp.]
MNSGKLIIVSAPSGSGKTTLVKHLLETVEAVEFSISCATRSPRPNEIDGKDYYFISTEEFRQKIAQEAFAEWEEVYENNFYGTLKAEIDRIWDQNKAVIFDIDVVGGINLKKLYPENSLSIFIMPPSLDELESRLRNRQTETEEKLQMRIDKAEKELLMAAEFDTVILNDVLEESKKEMVDKIQAFLAE